MTRAVIDGMRDRGFGRIVNIGSINGQQGQSARSTTAAAKAGILGFTKALAQESAREASRSTPICPGYVDTEMVPAFRGRAEEDRRPNPGRAPRQGRGDRPLRLFLVADDAGFITGATLSVNGGQYMDYPARSRHPILGGELEILRSRSLARDGTAGQRPAPRLWGALPCAGRRQRMRDARLGASRDQGDLSCRVSPCFTSSKSGAPPYQCHISGGVDTMPARHFSCP